MEYKPREGVVLLSVCDTFLLAPTRAAFGDCQGIMQLSGIDAIFFKRLSAGAKVMDLCRIYGGLSFKDPEAVRPKVEEKLNRLYERGFLVKAEEDA